MLTKLAIKNLSTRRFRSFLGILSIAIGSGALLMALSLNNGIEQAGKNDISSANELNEITVRPNMDKSGVISFFSQSNENKLNKETITQLSALQNVKTVHKEIQYNGFASISGSVLGLTLNTDTLVFGLPEEFLSKDLADKKDLKWSTSGDEPYPALIPRKFLDLYNFTIASPQNLPKFTEDQLIGKKLKLYPNHSNFFPDNNEKPVSVDLQIVGFSDKVNLIGVTLPYHIVENLNRDFANTTELSYTEIFVEVENEENIKETAQQIEELGYNTTYLQKEFENLEAKLIYLKTSLSIIIIIILFTAGIAIISTFLAAVSERRREIGLLRAIGATKLQIKKLILTEASIIGLIGGTTGIAIGLIGTSILNQITHKKLESITFAPEKLFYFTPQIILFTLLFSLILSLLAGYIPSKIAANTDPVEALRG